MRTYTANWHIKRNGRMVEPGEQLDLSDEAAQALGAAVSLVETADDSPDVEPGEGKKRSKKASA